MTIRRDIECFHLLFCKAFLSAQDKTLIVLKGGCNLRFFLGSDRYSEDIDFDVEQIAKETLRKRVEKVLAGQGLKTSLAAFKVTLLSHSAPRQTDTVQRWKVMLRVQGLEVPSKIEFSRRGIHHESVVFETVDPLVMNSYRLPPSFLAHYSAGSAILQKLEALALRAETQARDIYDLGHLVARYPKHLTQKVDKKLSAQALDSALSVDFDQFNGQVVEYLEGDSKAFYEERINWEKLQGRVVELIEGLR